MSVIPTERGTRPLHLTVGRAPQIVDKRARQPGLTGGHAPHLPELQSGHRGAGRRDAGRRRAITWSRFRSSASRPPSASTRANCSATSCLTSGVRYTVRPSRIFPIPGPNGARRTSGPRGGAQGSGSPTESATRTGMRVRPPPADPAGAAVAGSDLAPLGIRSTQTTAISSRSSGWPNSEGSKIR